MASGLRRHVVVLGIGTSRQDLERATRWKLRRIDRGCCCWTRIRLLVRVSLALETIGPGRQGFARGTPGGRSGSWYRLSRSIRRARSQLVCLCTAVSSPKNKVPLLVSMAKITMIEKRLTLTKTPRKASDPNNDICPMNSGCKPDISLS